ncbi:MAG: VOC family protein [Pseudomonadota bacterium]
MTGALFMVTFVVPDMDKAIAHYTRDWGFALEQDSHHASGHRWVVVDPGGGAKLRLVEARSDIDRAAIGNQAGTNVAFFLRIADFHRTIDRWSKTPIKLLEAPRDEAYGRVAVVADAFGNRWDVFDEAYESNA